MWKFIEKHFEVVWHVGVPIIMLVGLITWSLFFSPSVEPSIPDPEPVIETACTCTETQIAGIQKVELEQSVIDIRTQWVESVLVNIYNVDKTKSKELAPVITTAAIEQHVPVEILVSLIYVESRFHHDRVSKSGAIGYTQIMPQYWQSVPYDINDPHGNIFAGAFILRHYYTELASWDSAIKAYNIGITNYRNKRKVEAGEFYYRLVKDNLKRVLITKL